jgi:hypothetical protein
MDQIYGLLLIFVPVPVILLSAIIVEIRDRKKESIFAFNHLQSKVRPAKSWGSGNHKIGQPSAS